MSLSGKDRVKGVLRLVDAGHCMKWGISKLGFNIIGLTPVNIFP